MKNTFFIIAICFIFPKHVFSQNSGDTITVQTLSFADITKRRGWYIFPKDTNQYCKILMYYTLKCDAATTQDNYPCGEWDYTTFTNLFKHKNINTPLYYLGNSTPNTISYLNEPKFDVYQHYDYSKNIASSSNEDSCVLGVGTVISNAFLNGQEKTGRSQFLILANELFNQGITPGQLSKFSLDFTASGIHLKRIHIKAKTTSSNMLSDSIFDNLNFSTIYEKNTHQTYAGTHVFNLINPINWNANDNLIIDITYETSASTSSVLYADTVGIQMGLTQSHNGHFDFNDDDIIDVPATVFNDIDSAITISFWCYGDENKMPFNSYVFEGRDQNGYRVVNCHLPWSNSNVYWDAGNNGTGSYDRVNQTANFNDFAGKWNHWAFTKDVQSGEMVAYLNGEVFMSGTTKTRLMSGISSFRIGGTASSGFNGVYDGKIDEFRIWNTALDQQTIKNWMNRSIVQSHPYYAYLKVAYNFNDIQNHACLDYGPHQYHGSLLGQPELGITDPQLLHFNVISTSIRPVTRLYQGNYISTLDSSLYYDTVYGPSLSIVETQPYVDMNIAGISETLSDTIYGFESGWGYEYNSQGMLIDSTDFGSNFELTNHYKEEIHQLQNYVTPYGIGLDLGPHGFRWVYDVTDYSPLFVDTLEIRAGNQQELIDLKFVMIKGIPPRDVIDVETIWRGDYGHANIANDISLPPVDIPLNPNASDYKVKTRTTGHWFGGFQNCAEFCPKLHHVKINGVKEFEWLNWKECANNPVIAQGGTWIYDRAGWCPGTFGTTYDHEITDLVNPGDTVNIDYGMQVTSGGMEGNYRLTVQLISYGANNFQNDASIEDVIKPNKWEYYNRFNPMCDQPEIILKNTGEQTLENATIEYWICGGPHEQFTWNGNLSFDESENVVLPIPDQSFWDHAQFCKRFHVTITQVNGTTDEYEKNNYYSTTFETPPAYPNEISLWTRTNGAGYETRLFVTDVDGNEIFSRINFQNNTLYKDTLSLDPGCYKIELIDTDHDGLNFFANNDGAGYFQIRKPSGAPLAGFDSDFGDQITHYFTVGYELSNELNHTHSSLRCFPNPANSEINVELSGFTGQIEVEVLDALHKSVRSREVYVNLFTKQINFNISSLNAGLYFIKATDDYHSKIIKFLHE